MASTPASIRKHPIHPMLIALPVGLWLFSFLADICGTLDIGDPERWRAVAFYTLGGGIVSALFAAIPGFVDYLSLPKDSTPKKVAFLHMVLNLIAVAIFSTGWFMRAQSGLASNAAIWLSGIGVALVGLSGWLGGELVYRFGVAVDHTPTKQTTRERREESVPRSR